MDLSRPDRRTPTKMCKVKGFTIISLMCPLTGLASYHNPSYWFSHFHWFLPVSPLLSVSLSCVESCAHACLLELFNNKFAGKVTASKLRLGVA